MKLSELNNILSTDINYYFFKKDDRPLLTPLLLIELENILKSKIKKLYYENIIDCIPIYKITHEQGHCYLTFVDIDLKSTRFDFFKGEENETN